MVQPQKPPVSIRLGDERLARIDAYAAEHHLSRHLAILLMLDEGYRSLTEPPLEVKHIPPTPVAWPSGAVILPGHVRDPGPDAPLTMPRAAYGSRQKKPKGSK